MSIAGCSDAQPTYGVVVFDAVEFQTQFPSFATLSPSLLQIAFDLATLLLNNSCASVVADAVKRQSLLYLLTAHIASVQFGENGKPPTGVVGRISDAQQGSITVRSQWATDVSDAAAYYLQSSWGALYWRATAVYRTGRYFAPPRRRYSPQDPRLRGFEDDCCE